MAGEKNMRKVEAHVPREMWDQFETWAQARGPVPTRYLMIAMLRLFLAAPESIKLLALYGRGDQLENLVAMREDLLAAELIDAAEADAAAPGETPATSAKAPKRSGRRLRRQTG